MGISMGANTLLKYAGEEKENCPLKALVSIANPYDLHACAVQMSTWRKWIYDQQLLRGFKRLFTRHQSKLQSHPEIKIDVGKFQKKKNRLPR